MALLATAAAPSLAQWRDWPPAPQWSEGLPALQRASFGALDRNFDFALSREEAAASRPVALNFQNADLDADGRLSALEFNNIALALAESPVERLAIVR
ncbi:MAG TPA: hypothetical protein VFR83_11145 [Burkholderiales bacterium]|nr:hypothetical protein [Burkholderiales bacterium]